MNAIMVSVDYADLLAITLPRNRHHFKRVLVVTGQTNGADARVALRHDCDVYRTDAFWRDGADFNKWAALEEGLDVLGRQGWLCLMDADVLWPHDASLILPRILRPGFLYGPLRRMVPLPAPAPRGQPPLPLDVEACWQNAHEYPLHRNIHEWAGYTQIFHAEDPVLGAPPWHETDWRHAGGADSYFQARWPMERKVRLPWHVLHLGPSGENWCGRATPYMDGTCPAEGEQRRGKVRQYLVNRPHTTGDRHRHERLGDQKGGS